MSDEREEHEEEDKSIVEALGQLGWVEENEVKEEVPEVGEDLAEQVNFFKEENKRLIGEINDKNDLINEKVELINNLESHIQTLSKQSEDESDQDQTIQKLYETIESKNDEIEHLNTLHEEESTKSKKIIDDQIQKIQELTAQIDDFDQSDVISKKDVQIKELEEQLQYLEGDTIQKSKFQKAEVLLEKKDEIITEKEKTIFTLENSLKTANQKIQEIQQQQETFNLVKKDLEKKSGRNKELLVEIEELKQKNITNLEIVNRLEEKLEDAHRTSGNITGKFEVELSSLRNVLDGKNDEIITLKENFEKVNAELQEFKTIEEKILGDIQDLKDNKLKLESEMESKDTEIIDLKKKIKLMRRDMQKTK
jgi:chromosome segregation ATPase